MKTDFFAGCQVDYIKLTKSYTMRTPHTHDYYEIYFLVDGNRRYFLANKICNVLPYDVFIIKPGEPHQNTCEADQPYERYLLNIDAQLMKAICRENKEVACFADTDFLRLEKEVFREVIRLVKEIKSEIYLKDSLSPSVIKNMVSKILLLLLRAKRSPNHEPHLTEKNDIRLQSSIDYLLSNYNEPITLEDCAKIACMSPSHFSRLFHSLTSMTFKEYLNKIRIEKACELLYRDDYSVTELSLAVGFNSSSYFGHVFKEQTGMTPLAFRKSIK